MRTHRSRPLPRRSIRRIPNGMLFADGVQRLYEYSCRRNLRHRVAVPSRSLELLPARACPLCAGELGGVRPFWEGEIPAAGVDPETALHAIDADGYYAWTVGDGGG